jgi:MraZ protein
VEPDRQGRISIPQHLREYAKIERETVIVGVGGRIEIWGLENWKRYIAKVQADAPNLASGLEDLSI